MKECKQFLTYTELCKEIIKNPKLANNRSKEAVEVVTFDGDYKEIVYSYLASVRWAAGIYREEFCQEHNIKFRIIKN